MDLLLGVLLVCLALVVGWFVLCAAWLAISATWWKLEERSDVARDISGALRDLDWELTLAVVVLFAGAGYLVTVLLR